LRLPPEFRPIAERYGAQAAAMLYRYLVRSIEGQRRAVERYRRWLEEIGVTEEKRRRLVENMEGSLAAITGKNL